MDPLNVCLVNDSFPPAIDGVANAVVNYGEVIARQHGRATVVTPYYPNADDSTFPFPVVRYPSVDMTKIVGYRAGMPFSYEVFRRLEAEAFDIIHSHCPITSTLLSRALRERIHVPLVFTYHTKFDIDIANAVHSRLLQESATRILAQNIAACDEVWVVSRGAGDNLRKLGYEGPYTVMPNGVDLPRGRVDDDLIRRATEGFDLPTGLPVFLFVGRMMWYKGIRIILDALRRLADSGMDFRMVFVGDGGDKDAIVTYTQSLGLADKVSFSPPVRDRNLIRAWYCRADLFLFPSTFDTNGLVVREAAACGLASVLVRDSCAAEDVADGENGFLIEENAASMAAALTKLIAAPEAMRQVGEGAQQDLYMSWAEAVSRAYERYRAVIENYRSGKYTRRDTFTDELFRGMAGVMGVMDRSRQLQRQFQEQMYTDAMNSYDGFMNRIDRFL
ncbi:MAG: glycosyltransferase family 4 protein [Ruminococcaceae bacterium]|nr:glycosyltransferase family 4 protein [Oscillospiraceae bacterium]